MRRLIMLAVLFGCNAPSEPIFEAIDDFLITPPPVAPPIHWALSTPTGVHSTGTVVGRGSDGGRVLTFADPHVLLTPASPDCAEAYAFRGMFGNTVFAAPHPQSTRAAEQIVFDLEFALKWNSHFVEEWVTGGLYTASRELHTITLVVTEGMHCTIDEHTLAEHCAPQAGPLTLRLSDTVLADLQLHNYVTHPSEDFTNADSGEALCEPLLEWDPY